MNQKVFSKKHFFFASEYFISTNHLNGLSDVIDKPQPKIILTVTGITKSRLNKDVASLKNINLQHYNIHHTTKKYNKGDS